MKTLAPAQPELQRILAPPYYFERWAGADGLVCATRNMTGSLVQFRVAPAEAMFQCVFYRQWWYFQGDEGDAIRRGFLDPLVAIGDRLVAQREAGAATMSEHDALLWTLFLVSLRRRHVVDGMAAAMEAHEHADADGTIAVSAIARLATAPAPPPAGTATARWQRVRRAVRTGYHPTGDVGALPLEVSAIRPLQLREWYLLDLAGTPHRLQTSDQPCIFTGAMDDAESIVYLPVTPTLGFFALAEGAYVKRRLLALTDAAALADALNTDVAVCATRFVYTRNASDVPSTLQRENLAFDRGE